MAAITSPDRNSFKRVLGAIKLAAQKCPRVGLNEFVDKVLEEFLPAAGIGPWLAFAHYEGFQRFEVRVTALDLRTDAGVP